MGCITTHSLFCEGLGKEGQSCREVFKDPPDLWARTPSALRKMAAKAGWTSVRIMRGWLYDYCPDHKPCPAIAIVGSHRYRCQFHDESGHHFAAYWPACPAPFCRLKPGHDEPHEIPSGTPEIKETPS